MMRSVAVMLHRDFEDVAEMDLADVVEWFALLKIKERKEHERFAMLAVTMNRSLGGKAKFEDFMPQASSQAKSMDEQIHDAFLAWAKSFKKGGTV